MIKASMIMIGDRGREPKQNQGQSCRGSVPGLGPAGRASTPPQKV
jgi:hypothetical protein